MVFVADTPVRIEEVKAPRRDLSARRIVGFACNQAFLFVIVFFGTGAAASDSEALIQNVDLLATLVSLVIGFALVRIFAPQRIDRLFSRPLLYVYAVVVAAGSLLLVFIPEGGIPLAIVQGLLVGVPSALLLTAWGRTFGSAATSDAVPEVFLGLLVGALLCLLISLLDSSEWFLVVTRILPLGSVVNIAVPPRQAQQGAETVQLLPASRLQDLSFRILGGTFCFGVAFGLIGPYGISQATAPAFYRLALVLFGSFLLGSLSLLLSRTIKRSQALNSSYRLAILLMMAGVLIVPLPQLAGTFLQGQAVVLAGYLGLMAVMVVLFIEMAKLSGGDCAVEFSWGFTALFAGQLIGALIADVAMGADWASAATVLLLAAASGLLALVAYIFLFTERDFDALSSLVTKYDTFDEVCQRLTKRFGLSARESEILSFALRGRTNERIAQELVIAKSTVDTHLRRIYTKCGVHSRQELLDLAEEG